MSVVDRPAYKYGFEARRIPQRNRYGLASCDHFALPSRDPECAGKFYEHVLGGVEFFRAGYGEDDRAKGKSRHIFYHVGATLIELVEQRNEQGYPDVSNPGGENMNPHWAFGTTPAGLLAFAEHLREEGVPYTGPRRHGKEISAVSVYFQDPEGNHLEVTTWDHVDEQHIVPVKPGERLVDFGRLAYHWEPRS